MNSRSKIGNARHIGNQTMFHFLMWLQKILLVTKFKKPCFFPLYISSQVCDESVGWDATIRDTKGKHSPPPRRHEIQVCGKSVILSFALVFHRNWLDLEEKACFDRNNETFIITILSPSQCGSKSSPVQKLTTSNGCDNRQIGPELA